MPSWSLCIAILALLALIAALWLFRPGAPPVCLRRGVLWFGGGIALALVCVWWVC